MSKIDPINENWCHMDNLIMYGAIDGNRRTLFLIGDQLFTWSELVGDLELINFPNDEHPVKILIGSHAFFAPHILTDQGRIYSISKQNGKLMSSFFPSNIHINQIFPVWNSAFKHYTFYLIDTDGCCYKFTRNKVDNDKSKLERILEGKTIIQFCVSSRWSDKTMLILTTDDELHCFNNGDLIRVIFFNDKIIVRIQYNHDKLFVVTTEGIYMSKQYFCDTPILVKFPEPVNCANIQIHIELTITYVVTQDGIVYSITDENIAKQIIIPNDTKIDYMVANHGYVFAVAYGRTLVYAWGWNDVGQLGIGSTESFVSKPTILTLLDNMNIAAIIIRGSSTFAVVTGKLYMWGSKGGMMHLDQYYNTPQLIKYFDRVEILTEFIIKNANKNI